VGREWVENSFYGSSRFLRALVLNPRTAIRRTEMNKRKRT